MMPAPLTTAVFNVTDGTFWNGFGIDGLYLGGTHPSDNVTNLNAMIALLLNANGPTGGLGGTLEFPTGGKTAGATFAFNGTIVINVGTNIIPATIVFRGDGQGTLPNPVQGPILLQNDGAMDFFSISTNTSTGDNSIVGVVFQDLMLSYSGGVSGSGAAAVHVVAGQNVRLYRVTLYECPIGLYLENATHCSMIDCNVYTAGGTIAAGIALQLGPSNGSHQAIETYIAGCTFLQFNKPTAGTGTAVLIYGCEHLRMINTRLEGWATAILISPGATSSNVEQAYFGNVSAFTSGAAVQLKVSGGTSSSPTYIARVWFAECEFGPGLGDTGYAGGGIVISPTDTNDIIDQVRFVDCNSCSWLGQGLDIQGGTNLQILGGHYSCNGNTTATPLFPYSKSGIVVSAANNVRITGAACNNSVFGIYPPQGWAPITQEYGIFVRAGAQNVRISSCDVTQNKKNGVAVDGSGGATLNTFISHTDFTGVTLAVITPVNNLQVVNCPGYNDQAAILLQPPTSPPTGTFYNYTFKYYGPITLYVWGQGVQNVKVNNATISIPSGSFVVPPNIGASITGGTPSAVIVGI